MNIHPNNYDSRKLALPSVPWILKQTWIDSLFIHYPVKKEVLQRLVPEVLEIDTFDGVGWVTIVPYLISDMRGRGFPPIPGLNQFPGSNLRTYVTVNGKPGVYFFHLSIANWISAKAARTFFCLPYFNNNIKMDRRNDRINFDSRLLKCQYEIDSRPFRAEKNSLEEWLLERYCLYTVSKRGVPFQSNIIHPSWVLYEARATIERNKLLSSYNIEIADNTPILHFSKRAEVKIWPLVRC